ncbi:hypothetical protein EYC84_001685 [Monilinia fructicola]|uniref:Uncharacterized protein n=1 Tax=Monilinia fructicola TaxID=38448 RepID=A0A5M9JQD2_MONFR|nr:hypothetical protein EYC84_001685 [Monilinia fructicola]
MGHGAKANGKMQKTSRAEEKIKDYSRNLSRNDSNEALAGQGMYGGAVNTERRGGDVIEAYAASNGVIDASGLRSEHNY